jgi:hypothetical protein
MPTIRQTPPSQVNNVVARIEQVNIPVIPVDGRIANATTMKTPASMMKIYF